MAKRRKYATYECLGQDCGTSTRLRVPAKTGPKIKPPGWSLVSIRVQDGDTGVMRQAQAVFCSKTCAAQPSETSPLGQRLKRYLEAEPAPAAVRYCCVNCEKTATLTDPQHTPHAMAVPEGWTAVPLVAADYSSGVSRMTSLPLCGDDCAKQLNPNAAPAERPPAVQRELARLFADIENEESGRVLGTIGA